jgi:hypothetical protein
LTRADGLRKERVPDKTRKSARKSSVKMTRELRKFLESGRKYPLNGGE